MTGPGDGPYEGGWRSCGVGLDLQHSPSLGVEGHPVVLARLPPPRGVPSTQKSPALSHLFRPREPAPSRLRVAQKGCSLLICQEAVVAEAHHAGFDFPALPCLQCPRVNASGVCETGESVCETQGSQRCFLRKVYEGRWVLRSHLGDPCLKLSARSGSSGLGVV